VSAGITEYDSLPAFVRKDGHSFDGVEEIRQIVANQTGFSALSTNGTVYTWGDGRYEACLGREVTDER
jgi:alpha-tubulin suppressor-like RCC1 family protein